MPPLSFSFQFSSFIENDNGGLTLNICGSLLELLLSFHGGLCHGGTHSFLEQVLMALNDSFCHLLHTLAHRALSVQCSDIFAQEHRGCNRTTEFVRSLAGRKTLRCASGMYFRNCNGVRRINQHLDLKFTALSLAGSSRLPRHRGI
jgi:hypothetical protein